MDAGSVGERKTDIVIAHQFSLTKRKNLKGNGLFAVPRKQENKKKCVFNVHKGEKRNRERERESIACRARGVETWNRFGSPLSVIVDSSRLGFFFFFFLEGCKKLAGVMFSTIMLATKKNGR